MLAPQGRDGVVLRLPFGDRSSPVPEDRLNLIRRAPFSGDGEDLADGRRNRVCDRAGRRRNRQADATEVVRFVVVRIRAAVVLFQPDTQHGALRVQERLLELEYRLSRLVAQTRTGVDAP